MLLTMKYTRAFFYISTYLCISVNALLYNENATILPWKPHNSSQVGQSLIYNGTYYLADRDNAIIHVIDLANHHQRTIKGFNGKPAKKGSSTSTTMTTSTTTAPATGTSTFSTSQLAYAELSPELRDSLATAGPNGMILLPDRNELYVADANSTVRVINLKHKKKKKVAKISTRGQLPTEQLAYSPRSGLVMVTNPLEDPEHPSFVSVINATSRRVLGRVEMPHAVGTMQQLTWDSATDKFYVSIRATEVNPGGEIDEIDPLTLKITNVISLKSCSPSGIAFGPNRDLFVGCSYAQIPTYGYGYSVVLDMASNGSVVGNISGVSGVGQAIYDPSANLYYAAAYRDLAITAGEIGAGEQRYTPTSQVAIINASTNSLIQSIQTGNITSHTVAVDPKTKQMVIPIKKQGIAVYNVDKNSTLSSARTAREFLDFPVMATGKMSVSSASMAQLSFGGLMVLFAGMMFL